MTRTDLIRLLLLTLHLNVPQRKLLDTPIRKSELVNEAQHLLEEYGILMTPIAELKQLSNHRYELFREVEVSVSQFQEIRQEFATAGEAARALVQIIFNDYPPGNIPGLPIEE